MLLYLVYAVGWLTRLGGRLVWHRGGLEEMWASATVNTGTVQGTAKFAVWMFAPSAVAWFLVGQHTEDWMTGKPVDNVSELSGAAFGTAAATTLAVEVLIMVLSAGYGFRKRQEGLEEGRRESRALVSEALRRSKETGESVDVIVETLLSEGWRPAKTDKAA